MKFAGLPPTELILNDSLEALGQMQLKGTPQPGTYLTFEGKTYAILERRHRYQFSVNQYHLHQIILYVKAATLPTEKSWLGDRWVIGDASCRFNAHSEIFRCAVNPIGPCQGCATYEVNCSPL